jgi:hypothetical protein
MIKSEKVVHRHQCVAVLLSRSLECAVEIVSGKRLELLREDCNVSFQDVLGGGF